MGGFAAFAQAPLPGAAPLAAGPQPAAEMSAGIDKFLTRELGRSVLERRRFWHRDFSSPAAYEQSIRPNRDRLRRMLGAEDPRAPGETPATAVDPALLAEDAAYTVQTARWPVLSGLHGEGLLLRPKGPPVARVVAIPDPGQTPEMIAGLTPGLAAGQQFARRLAENGCEVLAPVLIDRRQPAPADPPAGPPAGQSRREVIYRRAFPLGRHLIGLEAQKVMAAVDFFKAQPPDAAGRIVKIGIAGYAEGGLLALYAAALDPRIDAVLVSGYFDSRQAVWEEPLDRNLFGLLREFGDAELASLVAPHSLVIEYSPLPGNDAGPDAASGKLSTPDSNSVETEFERARAILDPGGKGFSPPVLITGTEGATCGPGSDRALTALLNALGVAIDDVKRPGPPAPPARPPADPAPRQQRQYQEILTFFAQAARDAAAARDRSFWAKTNSPPEREAERDRLRHLLWEQTLGRLDAPAAPLDPRSRRLELPPAPGQADPRRWTTHEVRIDVCPDVFAGGYLLVPQDLKEGERRPAVVCQRPLCPGPEQAFSGDSQVLPPELRDGLAAQLADHGFVVFAMQNPARSLALERKANPLGLSLLSFVVAQHGRLLDWLATLPFVDPARIGFYALSCGDPAILSVPAILDRYSVSVCSLGAGDDAAGPAAPPPPDNGCALPEFGLDRRFGLAEFAALAAPRPFLLDCARAGKTAAELAAADYAKARGFYEQLGVPDRIAITPAAGSNTNTIAPLTFLQHHLALPGP